MLAVVKEAPEPGLAFEAQPEAPAPAPGEALLRPLFNGVCGTDLHIESWEEPHHDLRGYLPTVLGHEVLAEVLEAKGFSPGERVVALSVYGCGRCELCYSGAAQLCPKAREESIGMARDGGLAELMTLPEERLLPVPESLPDTVAALCEPFATATRAARSVKHRSSRRVAVLGPGTIGSMVATVAALSEPDRLLVVGTPSDTERLELAREEFGLDTLILGEDSATDIVEALGGPADVVFEAAGSPLALEAGLEALAPGGEMVVVGLQGEPLNVPPGKLVRREISLRGSYAAGPGDWETALGLMGGGEVQLSPLVGPIFDLPEASSAFRATEEGVLGRALVRCSS